MKQWVAWLRGINAGAAGKGRKSVPMVDLRGLAEGLSWEGVQTYLQSGNLLFSAKGKAADHEVLLEEAILERFKFEVPVCVLPISDLVKARSECPFLAEAKERANHVHIGFVKREGPKRSKVRGEALSLLAPYCKNGERCIVVGSFLWIDFANGVGRSKITPSVLDRAAGASVTMRNMKTLTAVCELLG